MVFMLRNVVWHWMARSQTRLEKVDSLCLAREHQ